MMGLAKGRTTKGENSQQQKLYNIAAQQDQVMWENFTVISCG
jgi:hypothetical protein